YFLANDGIHGKELWKTDGTVSGTVMLKDINPNPYLISVGEDNHFLILNNEFYFYANDGTNGGELWKSDGTEAGTVMIKDINLTTSAYRLNGVVLDDFIIFYASNGISGYELWRTDGTSEGTYMIKDIYEGASSSINDFDVVFAK